MKQHCLQDPDKVEATIVNRKYIYERWYEWIFRFNFRFWTFEASFKALCHFAKDLAEQVGYACDEVEEGESKEKTKSPTELTYQWVRRENQHLVRKNIMIEEDKSLRLLKRVVTLKVVLLAGYIRYVHARYIGIIGGIKADAGYIVTSPLQE